MGPVLAILRNRFVWVAGLILSVTQASPELELQLNWPESELSSSCREIVALHLRRVRSEYGHSVALGSMKQGSTEGDVPSLGSVFRLANGV